MGRGSALPRWLRDCGAVRVSEEAEDSGFLYYTRYFRAPDGRVPEFRAALLTPVGSFSVLTLPGDHGTWSVTLYLSAGDRPLKWLRLPEKWTALLRACPLHAHWLEGEPITGVLAMGGVIDRYRRLVVDGRPVATGIATVADSWACTNPSLGRGIALGLVHAARLRDVFRAHGDDPPAFSAAWDDVTERELTPWYRATVAVDRARLAEIGALRAGLPAPAPAEPAAVVRAALAVASLHDPDAFRAALEITGCLALPEEVFARSGLVERVLEIARDRDASRPVGPDRDELLRLVA